MKRLLSILFVMALVVPNALARKSYVNMVATNVRGSYCNIYLSGDIPAGMSTEYFSYPLFSEHSVGEVLNLLAQKGFVVEQMNSTEHMDGSSVVINEVVILSRTSQNDDSGAPEIVSNDDSQDVHEVARYNLQGMQVTENDKGIQIIVYSNFTTKTIIVE